MSKAVLLIHGAGHGAWCWEVLAKHLAARGWAVTTLDLPGLGDDRAPPAQVTFDDYVDAVLRAMKASDVPLMLAAHSMGGLPMSAAAEALPAKVRSLLYITSLIPKNGESVAEIAVSMRNFAGPSALDIIRPSIVAGAYEFDAEHAAAAFYNRCPPEIAAGAIARLRPQAIQPLRSTTRLSTVHVESKRKAYVVCTDDRAIPVAAQRWFCDRSPEVIRYEIDTDHSPFYSTPKKLVEIFEREHRTAPPFIERGT